MLGDVDVLVHINSGHVGDGRVKECLILGL